MTLIDWFKSFFNKDVGGVPLDVCIGEIAGEVFYKELALQSSINLIANTITKSEFLTYEKGKEIRKENYYLLNVEPNQNKTASKFWRDVISALIYKNECLVIQQDGMFYVADSFDAVRFAFKENIYKNIIIEEYPLKNVYYESQVFHFELHNEKIKNVIDSLCESYSKLIKVSSTNLKRSKARRGVLKIDASYPQTEEATKDLEDLLKNRFKRFFEAEGGAVLPLSNGLDYDELSVGNNAKNITEGRDIRAFINDIFDFVAIALSIPPQLLKGEVVDTKDIVNNFLAFCVNPIAKMITDEVNRKLYGKEAFLERTYAKLDTTRVKVADIKDIANALDVLTRIGAYCVDDSLRILGMEPLNTDWSRARWMTKNYMPIEEMLKGGE